MKQRRSSGISPRKQPRQARSTRLVADTLEAAIRVLTRDGAQRFTAARVAAEAGVSVGSLYQYFPNKEAILFRLQTDEWRRTGELLDRIMDDATHEPEQRLREMVVAFFRSEWEEAELRTALGDAAPAYRDAPEVAEHRRAGRRRSRRFMAQLLPQATPQVRRFAGELVMGVTSSMGKNISERARSAPEVEAWAVAIGDMLCAYLRDQGHGRAGTVPERTATTAPASLRRPSGR
jgi:AcrR family transcriptional regulator